ALTGHLVLTSLHGTDAAGALERFLDLGIEPFLVASSVIGVVGQRLVRRICRYCSVTFEPPIEEIEFYRRMGGPEKKEIWHGEGAEDSHCRARRAGVHRQPTQAEAERSQVRDHQGEAPPR